MISVVPSGTPLIDWNIINDHNEPENCLFNHFYSDEKRGEEFTSRMIEVLSAVGETDTVARFILNEFTTHIGSDEYHSASNRKKIILMPFGPLSS